jgi:hypothetical protein
MRIDFKADMTDAVFTRDPWTGRAELRVEGQTIELASPTQPGTHFTTSTREEWQAQIGSHDVTIVKTRPRFFGGLRRNSYIVSVEGRVVANAHGF